VPNNPLQAGDVLQNGKIRTYTDCTVTTFSRKAHCILNLRRYAIPTSCLN